MGTELGAIAVGMGRETGLGAVQEVDSRELSWGNCFGIGLDTELGGLFGN